LALAVKNKCWYRRTVASNEVYILRWEEILPVDAAILYFFFLPPQSKTLSVVEHIVVFAVFVQESV